MLFNSFLISLNAIISIFIMMAVGYGAKRLLHLEKEHIQRFNSLVFHTLLPLMLFYNIYASNIRDGVNARCLGLALSVLLALFLLTWLFVKRVEPANEQRGVMIQASFRSNFLLLGMPLIQELCPSADLATVSVMLAIVVPCFNVLAVVTLETFSREQINSKKILLGILKNPLILASVVGVLVNLLGLHLPVCLANPVSQLGASASPVALLLLGAQFEFCDVRTHRRNLAICTVLRLIVYPGVSLSLAALVGLRGPDFAVLISMFATPTAVASFSMATQMGGDPELAASASHLTISVAKRIFGKVFVEMHRQMMFFHARPSCVCCVALVRFLNNDRPSINDAKPINMNTSHNIVQYGADISYIFSINVRQNSKSTAMANKSNSK